jgi:hypothetical protein
MVFLTSIPDGFKVPIGFPDNHTIQTVTFLLPCFRILFLVPLLANLLSLCVVSTSVRNGDSLKTPELDALAGDTSNLGTSSAPITTSSNDERQKVIINTCVHFSTFNLPVFIQDEERELPWRVFVRRVRRITPFIWPSKSLSLQFLAVSL